MADNTTINVQTTQQAKIRVDVGDVFESLRLPNLFKSNCLSSTASLGGLGHMLFGILIKAYFLLVMAVSGLVTAFVVSGYLAVSGLFNPHHKMKASKQLLDYGN